MRIELKQVLFPQPKSKIKASDGKSEGKYKFFTSSPMQTRFIDEANYDKPSLIFGTGGNASVHFCDEPFSTSTDCLVMYGRNKIELESIYNYLKCNISLLEHGFKGAGLKHISKDYILAIEIELPSEAMQHEFLQKNRIVDEIIEAKRTQLLLSEDLVKSRFIEMFGDPKNNPNGYLKKRLKDTCRVITGNTPSRAVSEYYGNSIEWIKTDNIVEGMLHPTVATESLSEKGLDVGRTVESDSILMACIAGSLSSIGRVCVTDRKVAFNQQINAIEPNDYNALFLYVMLQLSKEYLIEEINMALKGILSKSKLEGKVFIVPPMDLQQQFAAFVEQVDKSKFYIVQMQILLRLLIRAIQQKTTEVLL